MSDPVSLEEALIDPASAFSTPEEVAAHPTLTREQKIAILGVWEYDAAEIQVATEDGTPGGDDDLMERILRALDGVIGNLDGIDTAPDRLLLQ